MAQFIPHIYSTQLHETTYSTQTLAMNRRAEPIGRHLASHGLTPFNHCPCLSPLRIKASVRNSNPGIKAKSSVRL